MRTRSTGAALLSLLTGLYASASGCCALHGHEQIFVIADGMGGHAAGEVAAGVAVESIEKFIRRSHETTDVSWPFGIDPTVSLDAIGATPKPLKSPYSALKGPLVMVTS